MHDSQIAASKIITVGLWAWVLTALVTAWIVWLAGPHELAVMLGFTACASSAVAATSQIRCYTLRVCGLLRVVGGLETPRSAEVHSLR